MERGEGSHGSTPKTPKPIPASTKPEVDDSANNNTSTEHPRFMREQDQYMPIANVIRIMRRILPAHAKISDDAKETIQECVSEYISFITSEANERCHREQRKTITAEDLLWAMGRLGFDNYIEPLTVFLNRYREAEAVRTTAHGEPSVKRTVDFGVPGNYGVACPIPMGARQGFYNVAAMNEAMHIMNSYYRDNLSGAGGSSSQSPTAIFDPFPQFK